MSRNSNGVSVDLAGTAEWSEVVAKVRSALEEKRAAVRSRHARGPPRPDRSDALSWSLIRDKDLMLAEAEQAARLAGDTWVEKLELGLSPPRPETSEAVADPMPFQNPYMVSHPPLLYLGYVGLAVPFAFAMGSLLSVATEERWIVATRRSTSSPGRRSASASSWVRTGRISRSAGAATTPGTPSRTQP